MAISLDSIILGNTTDMIFAIALDNEVLINDIAFNIHTLKISNLKEYIWYKKRNKFSINDPNEMNLWKVNIGRDQLKDIYAEEDILNKFRGEKMEAGYLFTDYFKVNQPAD